jgi:alpha-tubulin suppressor-like RCC1 family protein
MISGGVECWGNNSAGQDGNGTTNPQLTPGCVTDLTGVVPAVQVVEGDSHSCVLFSDGGVWCWGDNSVGQLGSGMPSSSSTPLDAQALDGVDQGNPPTQISAGGDTTCALLSDGSVWCWGSNNQGQLGTGSANSSPNGPTLVPVQAASQVAVSPGGAFVCALLVSGGVDCWGTGYLGDMSLDTNSAPVSAFQLTNATQIAVGNSHACAIVAQAGTPSNVLYCWGDNTDSEIGEGDVNTGAFNMHEAAPVVATQVSGCTSTCPPPVQVTGVALGDKYTCVVVAGGTVKCWGDDTFGQLGNGTTSTIPSPAPEPVNGLTGVAAIAAGPGRVCAQASAGGISCWGEGPVGDGSTGAVGTATQVTFVHCP